MYRSSDLLNSDREWKEQATEKKREEPPSKKKEEKNDRVEDERRNHQSWKERAIDHE